MQRRREAGRSSVSSSRASSSSRKMENYKKERVIGKGSYGKVYLVKHRKKGKYFAMKIVRLTNIPRKERESVRTELALLKKLNHPNIVAYEEAFAVKQGTYLAIVMGYCDCGDLGQRLKKARRPFPEHQVLHWFVQMALGLEYMHSQKILHRDIKTQNVFLLGNGRLVLGDLGISKALDGTLDMAKTSIGTPYYMSPEMFKNEAYNAKSDVWALGCVLYEMMTLKHAFEAKSLNGLAKKVVEGRVPTIRGNYSRQAKMLVNSMLSRTPRDRPTMPTVLTKPYVRKHILGFLRPIVKRSENMMGDGTVVLKDVAMAVGSGGNLQPTIPEVVSMTSQLRALGLASMFKNIGGDDDVSKTHTSARATRTKAPSTSSSSNPSDILRVKRIKREARQALERNKERRSNVKDALSKLEAERKRQQEKRMHIRREGKYVSNRRKPENKPRAWGKGQRGGGRGGKVRGSRPVKKATPGNIASRRERPGARGVARRRMENRAADVSDVRDLSKWEQKRLREAEERDSKLKEKRKEQEEMRKRCEAFELAKQRYRQNREKEKKAVVRHDKREEDGDAVLSHKERVLARKAKQKREEEAHYRQKLLEARREQRSMATDAKSRRRDQYRESDAAAVPSSKRASDEVAGVELPGARYDEDEGDDEVASSKRGSVGDDRRERDSKLNDTIVENIVKHGGDDDDIDDGRGGDSSGTASEVEDEEVNDDVDADSAPDEIDIKLVALEKELVEIASEDSGLRRTVRDAKANLRILKAKLGGRSPAKVDREAPRVVPREFENGEAAGGRAGKVPDRTSETESSDSDDYEDDFDEEDDDEYDEEEAVPVVSGMPGALRERRQTCIDALHRRCGKATFRAMWAAMARMRKNGDDDKDHRRRTVGRFLGDVSELVISDVLKLIEQLSFVEMSMGMGK